MLMNNASLESTTRECWMDGKWVPYDLCSQLPDSYHNIENKMYLGDSDKCRINGIVQSGRETYHYWQRV